MGRHSRGARLREYGINEDVIECFLDFQDARRGVEFRLVQDALELYMEFELERDKVLKGRYRALRKARGRSK